VRRKVKTKQTVEERKFYYQEKARKRRAKIKQNDEMRIHENELARKRMKKMRDKRKLAHT
jgi:hypothetical protein